MKNLIEMIGWGANLFRHHHLTPKKMINLTHNMMEGYLFHSPRVLRYPGILVVDPTNACNLRCAGCDFQNDSRLIARPRNFMAFELYKKIIDELKDYIILAFLYMSGEPFLHKDIFRMIQYAADHNIAVIISTNGNFRILDYAQSIIKCRLYRIIFSISGTTQKVYEQYHHGGDLALVLENIRNLVLAKKKMGVYHPQIYLRYLEIDGNQYDRRNAEKLARLMGVDRLEMRMDNKRLVKNKRRNKPIYGVPKAKARNNFCFWLWSTFVVKPQGAVVPCCFDYFNLPTLGNIKDSSVWDVWNGPRYLSFRKEILSGRHKIPSCTRCNTKIGFQDQAFEPAY